MEISRACEPSANWTAARTTCLTTWRKPSGGLGSKEKSTWLNLLGSNASASWECCSRKWMDLKKREGMVELIVLIEYCTGIAVVMGSKLSFHNCSSCEHNCRVLQIFHSRYKYICFIYSYLFIHIMNSQNNKLQVGLIAQLVGHCSVLVNIYNLYLPSVSVHYTRGRAFKDGAY